MVSGGFRWFRVGSDGFGWFHVLSITLMIWIIIDFSHSRTIASGHINRYWERDET